MKVAVFITGAAAVEVALAVVVGKFCSGTGTHE